MRPTRPKSRLPVPVSTNTNNNKMAVASLPSTYAKFPLRILNKGPEYFRDQMGQERGHSQSHKSAAERLAESRTQYVRNYSKESEPREKVAGHSGGKETTQEMVQKSSPKQRNRNEQRPKSLQTTEYATAGDTTDMTIDHHKPDPMRHDFAASVDGPRISKSEEEMRSVGKLISRYQQSSSPNGYSSMSKSTNYLPQFGRRSPPQIPKKPKRSVSPSNRSCSDSDEAPFKRISVKQAAKSWENVTSIFDNHRNGVRKQADLRPFDNDNDPVQQVVDSNNVKLKAASIAKAWEKLTADLDSEENGKKNDRPPKVKLVNDSQERNTNTNNHCAPTPVKVKLTDGGSTASPQHAKLSKPLKVQLINNYNAGKGKEPEEDSNQAPPAPHSPIRATVKVTDSNMNNVGGSTAYERKDPKRAIRAKVEQGDNYAMGKVTNYTNHIGRHGERPRVQSQLSNQSEETNTDSSISAKVRLLLVQSKDNQTNVDSNNTSNKNESPTRGRSKSRKATEKSRNGESTKENNYRATKRSPQHHGRSKSSGPLYRMHLGSSQESSGQTYDSTKNTDTTSPRSSSPGLGSPRGSRIRRLQEQLMALCDTEDSSSFDSPESLGEGKFVRSRSSRSLYSKDSVNEDFGVPKRGSAPTRHKNKGKEQSSSEREKSPEKKSKVSSKGNVIVERRDMPAPIQVVSPSKQPSSKDKRNISKTSRVPVERKDTKSSFDSTDAQKASTTEVEFKETCDKIHTELFIVERPHDLGDSPVVTKRLESPKLEDSPSSSTKERYTRMTAIMLGSDVKSGIGAIENLPISIDVEVEYDEDNVIEKKHFKDKSSHKEHVIDSRVKHSASKAEVKGRERSSHKRSSRKHAQTSTDSEDIPTASGAVGRDKGFHVYETPKIDPVSESKHHRKRESRKKLYVYEDPDQQSADQIKSCHSPNMNNNRQTGSFERGSKMRRSCSDLDPPYLSKSHSELDRFFDHMGLDEKVLKRMESHSPMEEEAFHPMHEMKYYDSDSMYSNESDNISQGSKVSDDGLLRRHLTSRLPDQSQSIVMRNARVIKWLCQCRKARTQSVS